MSTDFLNEQAIERSLRRRSPFRVGGRITSVRGQIVVRMPARTGDLVEIHHSDGKRTLAEVIAFDEENAQIMPFDANPDLRQGDLVVALGRRSRVPVGPAVLGRTLNGLGQPLDDLGPLSGAQWVDVLNQTPSPLKRKPIKQVFETGQRAIDGLLTVGVGQRMGLFAGSGVGKSTLLGQIARFAQSDVNVVALIGERGREVGPFVQETLGPEGMKRSVVVVSTANESPLARTRAAESAVAIAGWFRDQGNNVLLMLDSLTRFAMAGRELGLSMGEPPTARGYTPSVFQKIAVLLEQMGNSDRGSITGLLTVLVEGDDMNDPIADSARSILDGHIVLDRALANSGHFPAINVLHSTSRLFGDLVDGDYFQDAICLRKILANHENVVDLLQVGAYQRGMVPETDAAIDLFPRVRDFLQQQTGNPVDVNTTWNQVRDIANAWRQLTEKPASQVGAPATTQHDPTGQG